ncbi:hypothetical protein ACYJ1Y_13195 [Natrialbaceae archaeon A-gly3]
MAWEAGSGTLRSSFQRLSRIDDEVGTREVYDQLAETDVSVHIYGVPDRVPELEVTVHGGDSDVYRDAWFVIYRPNHLENSPTEERGAALVALETEPRVWNGFWTYDDDRVADSEAYIDRAL